MKSLNCLSPKRKNVRSVAEAIVLASEIRAEIYNRRPDLTPEYFKKK